MATTPKHNCVKVCVLRWISGLACLLSPQAKGSHQSRPGINWLPVLHTTCTQRYRSSPDLVLSRPGASQHLSLLATFPSRIVHEGAARCCRPPNKRAWAPPTCAKPHLSRRKGFVSLWPVNVLVCLNSMRVGFYMGCNKKKKENKARLFKHKIRS